MFCSLIKVLNTFISYRYIKIIQFYNLRQKYEQELEKIQNKTEGED